MNPPRTRQDAAHHISIADEIAILSSLQLAYRRLYITKCSIRLLTSPANRLSVCPSGGMSSSVQLQIPFAWLLAHFGFHGLAFRRRRVPARCCPMHLHCHAFGFFPEQR